MAKAADANPKYVLFELLDRDTVAFRRSDMEFRDVRGQFLDLLLAIFGIDMTMRVWELELGRVPGDWGDFLAFQVGVRGQSERTARLLKADREPGVNAGENPVITSIRKTSAQ